MSPVTHLLASWIVAAKTTDNLTDRRLVTLAGVAPDLDGLGILFDLGHDNAFYYQKYHHWLNHGLPGAVVIAALLAMFGRKKWPVFCWCLVTFHLHLLCDLAGSKGPDAEDFWPIFYFGPISQHPMWIWKYQWGLDSWQNRVISTALFFWNVWIAVQLGDSFVGVINRKADAVFVRTLRKWCDETGLARRMGWTFSHKMG